MVGQWAISRHIEPNLLPIPITFFKVGHDSLKGQKWGHFEISFHEQSIHPCMSHMRFEGGSSVRP